MLMVLFLLRRYSLVKREPEKKVLNIHRLVQAVMKDEMDEEEQKGWVERVVRIVNKDFTEQPLSITDTSAWPKYQVYMPHAQVCAEMVRQWHPDVAITLEDFAALLRKTKRVNEAAALEERARAIRTKQQ